MQILFIQFLVFLTIIFVLAGLGLLCVGGGIEKFSHVERAAATPIVGFVVWTLLIYSGSLLHIRNLALVAAITLSVLGWLLVGRKLSWGTRVSRRSLLLLSVLFIGVAAQLFLVFPNGLLDSNGSRFFGTNIHDGLWHVALMRTLANEFPPVLPTFAGQTLKGYHFFVDLFGSELYRVFRLSPFDLTFRFLPFLFSSMTALGVYAIIKRISKSQISAVFGMLILFFAGSFGYILNLLIPNPNSKETLFWAQQSISTFLNLPLGASFATMIISILLFVLWLTDKKSKKLLWLALMVAAATMSIKAYGGLILMASYIGLFSLISLKERTTAYIKYMLAGSLLAASLLFPNINLGESTFIFEPGWFLKTMMESTDRVAYPKWELLRQTYLAENNLKRLVSLWGIAFLIFFTGNYGIRVVGFVALFKGLKQKRSKYYYIYVLFGFVWLFGLMPPLFLLQRGVVWNSIQFIYYSIMIMGVLTAMSITHIRQTGRKICIVIILFLLMIPTTIDTLKGSFKKYAGTDYYSVNPIQLEALKYASQLPGKAPFLTPYDESAFFTAFTGKSVYFVDKTQADILLIPVGDRIATLNSVYDFGMMDTQLSDFMKANDLTYLYAPRQPQDLAAAKFDSYNSLEKLFSNDYAAIYKVR